MATLRNPILALASNPDVRRFLSQRAGLAVEESLPDSIAEKLARLDAAVAARNGTADKN